MSEKGGQMNPEKQPIIDALRITPKVEYGFTEEVNNQPQKWTLGKVLSLIQYEKTGKVNHWPLVDAINAALAAEREKWQENAQAILKAALEELAAERERADKNVEDKRVVMHAYAVSQENDRLKEQLAVEREAAYRRGCEITAKGKDESIKQLREQLAAAYEKGRKDEFESFRITNINAE